MSATRFAINADPSRLHRLYALGLALGLWLPASLLLSVDRLPWFALGWLPAVMLMWRRCRYYRPRGEFNAGVLTLNGRSGELSHHSRAGPGFLLLVLKGDPWPPLWLFQDAVPDAVYRRLTRQLLYAG
ncbi:hypothetical protein Q9290_12345 [Oceanimonas sp. CHS3-5]|uniref:protein YgfX n=1 Tax=Oceanimonas sp. CHS3-5 TaxID=3068186 RepID=UPI00273E4FE1|nr:protein YgfX [Oceanimonas sp. CHS3-5]MDP5293071.1 hypothetical protein [Oceanimonas sp. CHS3-5]